MHPKGPTLNLLSKKNKTIGLAILLVLLILSAYFWFSGRETSAAWWNDAWGYRKALTIDGSKIAGDLIDFPVLVSLTDLNLSMRAQSDGDDIVFTNASGTKFSHEIESYDSASGTLVAWVKLPNLYDSTDATIYLYYGNASASNQEDKEKTWNHDFRGVWHMRENPASSATIYDSTSNSQDGTANNLESGDSESGKIGNGLHFDGTTAESVGVADNALVEPANNLTISAWVYVDVLATGINSFVLKGTQYYLQQSLVSSENRFAFSWAEAGPTYYASHTINAAVGSWFHIVGVRNGGNAIKIYVNGVPTTRAQSPAAGDVLNSSNNPLYFGYAFDGLVDEVRLSSMARSDEWVETEYNNQNDPGSFFTVQAEEAGGGPVAYWSFDEGSGTITHDESSNQNNGTISGALWKPESECVSGKCLYFDGSDDYVEVPENDSLAQTGQFTVEAWVKTNDTSIASQTIASKGNAEKNSTATQIYRSMGFGSTTALEVGTSNALTISGSLASFANDLGTDVGVGDVIQYDDDNDSDIDANDSLAFIHSRISAKLYVVKNVTGGPPTAVSGDTNWSLFRSYTSLAKAESGDENDGLDDDLEAFESWSGGKDISASTGSNEQWNIVCYADAPDTTWMTLNGWTTATDNYVRFYTPVHKNEVGVSQRHVGVWSDSAFYTSNSQFSLSDNYVRVEGLQFTLNITTYNQAIMGVSLVDANNDIRVSGNIFRATGTGAYYSHALVVDDADAKLKVWNNIIYGFKQAATSHSFYTTYAGGSYYLYNNTFYDSYNGVKSATTQTSTYLKNNVFLKLTSPFPSTGYATGTTHNACNNNTTGFNPITLCSDVATDFFTSTTNLNINSGATCANQIIDKGINLSADATFPIKTDITGNIRTGDWDLGADESNGAASSVRNYELSLAGDEPGLEWEDSGATARSYATTSANLPANTWKHLVYRRNASDEAIYIDGKKISEGSIAYSTYQSLGSLFVGAENQYGVNAFKGFLDEVKIYAYARNDSQIKQDYTAGKSGAEKAEKGTAVSFGSASQDWMTNGLVGYWKMDEASWNGTAGEVIDASGNSNNGTSAGGATTAVGKFGKGGVFDGTNDYLSVPDNDLFEIGTNSRFTVSAWVKTSTNDSNERHIVSKYNQGSVNGWFMSLGEGKVYSMIRQGATLIDNGSNLGSLEIADGKWHFVTTVYDLSSNMTTYVDGQFCSETAISGTLSDAQNSEPLRIGARGKFDSNEYFPGSIDDVRTYNRALSPAEVKKLYEWAPGPIIHFKLDEKTGTTTYDTGSAGYSGPFGGGTADYMPSWASGKYGASLSFDGSNDYVEVGDISEAEDKFFTYSLWIKTGAVSGTNKFFLTEGGSVASAGFRIKDDDDEITAFTRNDAGTFQDVNSVTAVANNQWHHLAMTGDGTTLRLYVDGKEEGTPVAFSGSYSLSTFGFGRLSRVSPCCNTAVILDDIRVYNYPRTQKQILEDMNGGTGSNGGKLQKPIAYYKFDEGYGSTVYNEGIGGTSFNGTLNAGGSGSNTTTTAMWDQNGKNGKAVEFDGTDDYVGIGSTAPIVGTVSLWIKPVSTTQSIIDLDGGSHKISISSGAVTATGFDSYYVDGKLSGTVSDTNWHQITAIDTTAFTTTTSLSIGKISSVYYSGLIDDVKIFNYALSEDDIKINYNSGVAAMIGSSGSVSGTGAPTNSSSGDYCIPGDTTSCVAPVVELKMDEKTSTTAYDTSGNGNNGTLTGTTWAQGKYGSGLIFDGSADYATITQNSSINNLDEFSLSFWMNPSVISGSTELVHKRGSSNPGLFATMIYQNKIWFASNRWATPGNWTADTTIISANNWYHIEIVYSYSSTTNNPLIVINGITQALSETQTPSGAKNSETKNLQIGDGFGVTYDYSGIIDDFKMYNYARTPAQIAWDYNKGKPVAEWRLNECQGTTVHDESANGNDGTINLGGSGVTSVGNCGTNASTAWYNGRTGKYAASLSFDGTDDYVGIGSTAPVVNSVSLWIKPTSTTQSIIVLDGGSHSISISSGAVTATGFNSYYVDGKLSGTVSDTNWHQIVAIANTAFTTTTSFAIGKISSTYYSGLIDDVKIFGYALTAEQVRQLYNNSSAIQFGN